MFHGLSTKRELVMGILWEGISLEIGGPADFWKREDSGIALMHRPSGEKSCDLPALSMVSGRGRMSGFMAL